MMPFAPRMPLPCALLSLTLASSATAEDRGAPPPVPGRSMVATRCGLVASSQPLASRAAVQALISAAARSALAALGHVVEVVPARSSSFGYGQAILSRHGVHFGASDPRHDGAAIPQSPLVFPER